MSTSSPPATSSRPRKSGSWTALIVVLLLVAAAGGYYLYVARTEGDVQAADTLGSLRPLVAELARYRNLDPRYKDSDGDLVADAPAMPRDPAELRFVGIPTDYAENPEQGKAVWKDFLDKVKDATGKPVVFVEDVKTSEEQLAGLRDGTLDITAFTTGQVPRAVNTAGFVPVACPADEKGNFSYEMEILVHKDSPFQSPRDLKGKKVAFSAMSSNSGSRAPMVVLSSEFQMLPGRDYQFPFSGDQLKSLVGLAAGQYDAVCVANDFARRVIADPKNKLSADQFRSIYKSKSFPPLCFGIAHDLSPELRKKLEPVLKSFVIAGTSVSQQRPEAKLAPVNYKLDWAFVREVDDAMIRLPDAK